MLFVLTVAKAFVKVHKFYTLFKSYEGSPPELICNEMSSASKEVEITVYAVLHSLDMKWMVLKFAPGNPNSQPLASQRSF